MYQAMVLLLNIVASHSSSDGNPGQQYEVDVIQFICFTCHADEVSISLFIVRSLHSSKLLYGNTMSDVYFYGTLFLQQFRHIAIFQHSSGNSSRTDILYV